MKKVGLTLLTALVGGAVALGGYKLFEKKQFEKMSFEERQQVHYTNQPISEITASTGNLDFTQAAAVVSPGVVNIKTTYTARTSNRGSMQGNPFDLFEEFFGPQQRRSAPQQAPQPAQASGSGVIISEDGYIVTNNHVVEGADKLEVTLSDRRKVEAKIIGRDPNTDIALIKINEKGLPFVKLGDSDKVRIGEWVLAVGYPLGLESTVTAGIVSATGRSTGIIAEELYQKQQQQEIQQYRQREGQGNPTFVNSAIESFIQTDAVINKGNSGGALVNAQGELIGINSNIMSPSGYYAGYGFAVPVNLVKKIADDFVKYGEVKRGLIGITFQPLDADQAKKLDVSEINGLYVNQVSPGGAAEKAGVKTGDIITKIDGKPIYASSDLQEKVYRLRPGDKINLTYSRGGKEKTINITLQGEEKAKVESKTSASATTLFNKLGASFVAASSAKKEELGVNSGVLVTKVHDGGLFEYYNIRQGLVITHINGKTVNNVDEVEAALAGGNNRYINIKGVPQRGSSVEFNLPISE